MATFDARATAIVDAVLNRASTVAERARLGKALAWKVGRLDEYTAALAAVKTEIAVRAMREVLVGIVQEYEVYVAQSTQVQAVIDARKSVETGFTEAP